VRASAARRGGEVAASSACTATAARPAPTFGNAARGGRRVEGEELPALPTGEHGELVADRGGDGQAAVVAGQQRIRLLRAEQRQGVLEAGTVKGDAGPLGWTATVLSFVVASTAGLSAYFKFRERAANARRAADAIKRENTAAALGIGRYRDRSPDELLEMLVEEVERLREEQRQREQQLEQRPETRRDDQGGVG
jgi:hypothetical protein